MSAKYPEYPKVNLDAPHLLFVKPGGEFKLFTEGIPGLRAAYVLWTIMVTLIISLQWIHVDHKLYVLIPTFVLLCTSAFFFNRSLNYMMDESRKHPPIDLRRRLMMMGVEYPFHFLKEYPKSYEAYQYVIDNLPNVNGADPIAMLVFESEKAHKNAGVIVDIVKNRGITSVDDVKELIDGTGERPTSISDGAL